jgi:hypothetical protein
MIFTSHQICGSSFKTLTGLATFFLILATAPAGRSARADDVVIGNLPRSPESFLGRPVGTDFQLADWSEVKGYYEELANTSPRVLLENVGKTSEGRDFLIAVISDEANLADLDQIKAHSKRIADPRGATHAEKRAAIDNGKVIVFVTPTMHSSEPAATEMAMQFAWMLATSDAQPWKAARKHAVVVITPSLNPDGIDHITHWYRQHVNTPLEGASLNKLYQLYTGHDNNRDWFMLTQAETRLLTRLLYKEWNPQFLWDVHQQGNSTERFFVPPYRDPLNPNLDPGIVAGINLIGTRAVMDMTRDGLSGIATGVSYDNWWNGGNRAVPGRHHIIGILTEAASVKLASPIFQSESSLKDPLGATRYQQSNQFIKPWPGGWWRLSDIVEYELSFGRSLLGSVTREPKFWLRNKMEAAQRSIDAGLTGSPRGWLIPPTGQDIGATRRLVDVLLETGVEVHVSDAAFAADGRDYPAGTLIISRAQPYGNYAKDLFELQDFPPGTSPYDVTGWTLPLLLGIRRVEVRNDFEVARTLATDAAMAVEKFSVSEALKDFPDKTAMSLTESDSWKKLVTTLADGQPMRMITKGKHAGVVTAATVGESPSAKAADQVSKVPSIEVDKLPRIGIYAPWSPSMDEGWMRWVFDDFEIPYQRIRNEQLRAGELSELIDVLVIPSITGRTINLGLKTSEIPDPMAGGIDPEGSLAVEAFVRQGGKLITMDSSATWAIDLFRFPIVDATKGAKGFSCPGSVLRGITQDNLLTAGLDHDQALFFSGSAAWRPMTKAEMDAASLESQTITSYLKYAPTRLLLSGFIEGPETIQGQHAWISLQHGQGTVHLFGFRPHYRAWSQTTFHLLFRAMLLDVN